MTILQPQNLGRKETYVPAVWHQMLISRPNARIHNGVQQNSCLGEVLQIGYRVPGLHDLDNCEYPRGSRYPIAQALGSNFQNPCSRMFAANKNLLSIGYLYPRGPTTPRSLQPETQANTLNFLKQFQKQCPRTGSAIRIPCQVGSRRLILGVQAVTRTASGSHPETPKTTKALGAAQSRHSTASLESLKGWPGPRGPKVHSPPVSHRTPNSKESSQKPNRALSSDSDVSCIKTLTFLKIAPLKQTPHTGDNTPRMTPTHIETPLR